MAIKLNVCVMQATTHIVLNIKSRAEGKCMSMSKIQHWYTVLNIDEMTKVY